MKKLAILSIVFQVLFFSKLAFGSQLVISSWNYSGFSLQIDEHYYGTVSNEFSFDNMRPGLHKVKVYKYIYNGFSQVNSLVFSGAIKVPVNAFVRARINRYGHVKVVQVLPLGYSSPSNELIIQEGLNAPPTYGYGMGINKFMGLKQMISRQAFDSSRLKIARQAIRHNGISSDQLLQLVMLLSFESSKLKLAKFAYPYVADKENFFVVNNAFSFSSSINNLYYYINRY
ncbi:MAG: hypothetical protein DRP35_10355 [Candidatus Zixiibacteriota bacterium]|nr:MAG: hypothetical protein DRP35_10355 [candidate division Zixibacteria bacterium]